MGNEEVVNFVKQPTHIEQMVLP